MPNGAPPTVISIHAPREGGDSKALQPAAIHFYFNPRPPRGGRHIGVARSFLTGQISIHAPREGGDPLSA